MSDFHNATRRTGLIAACILSSFTLACSDGGLVSGSAIEDAAFGEDDEKKPNNGGRRPKPPTDSTTTNIENGQDLSDIDAGDENFGDPDPNGGDDALKKLLEDCGATTAINAKPDDIIYQKNITSLPVTTTRKELIQVTVNAATNLQITTKPGETVQTNTVKILSVSPDHSLILNKANEAAKEKSGRLRLTNLPFNEITQLADKNAQWKSITCTIIPLTKIEATRGAYTTNAAFDPPAPTTISPRAIAQRYTEELGDRLEFTGIEATITSTNHPDLANKTKLTGTVTITKVSPEYQANGQTLRGDIAYKVVTDFGGPATTFALGFVPEVTYYINVTNHDFAGHVGMTKIEGDPTIVFIF